MSAMKSLSIDLEPVTADLGGVGIYIPNVNPAIRAEIRYAAGLSGMTQRDFILSLALVETRRIIAERASTQAID